jgi:hypothetical protein
MRRLVRLISCLAAVLAARVVLAAAASAHVSVSAVNPTQGAYPC